MKFTLDELPGEGAIAAVQLLYPNGTELYHSTDPIDGTASISFDSLEVILVFMQLLINFKVAFG